VPEADTNEQAQLPPRRDQVAAAAALDAIGLTLTAIAAVVLAVTDVNRAGRMVALVALAFAALSGVATTIVFVRVLVRRRTFVTNVNAVVSPLESRDWSNPSALHEMVRLATDLRKKAVDIGDIALAARILAATDGAPERREAERREAERREAEGRPPEQWEGNA
jgi:hypothetical protein